MLLSSVGEVGLLSSETRAQDGQILSSRQETAKGRAEGKELFWLLLERKGFLSPCYGFVLLFYFDVKARPRPSYLKNGILIYLCQERSLTHHARLTA